MEEFYCGDCNFPIKEIPTLGSRNPCPQCDSTRRTGTIIANLSIGVKESVSVTANYKPAKRFAESACKWLQEVTKHGNAPIHLEAPFLTLIYSCLTLEALIAQFLGDSPDSHDDLFSTRVSVLQRWQTGASRLCKGSPGSMAALEEIKLFCKDKGHYGLLVRTRNKLIHPRVNTEHFDDEEHYFEDGSVENLVGDLKNSDIPFPETNPAFPHMVQCLASAEWAVSTMKKMVLLLHKVTDIPISKEWELMLKLK